MLKTRVIPVLLLKGQGLYKTEKFRNPKYVGDPINAIKIFNDKEVDELVVLDIEASKYKREPNYAMISSFASQCFMPVTYGGGVKTIDQMRTIFSLGIEKISINNSILTDPLLIKSASQEFGSQSVVVSIDVKKNMFGSYQIYNHVRSKIEENLKLDSYLDKIVEYGAGEVFLNDVSRDGVMNGYDIELIHMVVKKVNLPVIICGGAGSIGDFKKAQQAMASGCGAGSLFVFHGKHRAVLITYPEYNLLRELLE